MRKTLLMAAAALAAGVISSQAGVYSANIVGYVNTPLPSGFVNLATPLDVADPSGSGVNNAITNIINVFSGNYDGDLLYTWSGTKYVTYTIDSTFSTGIADAGDVNPETPPIFNPGVAFYIKNSSTSNTLTFVGTVHVGGAGASTNVIGVTTNLLTTSPQNNFYSSVLPVGGGISSVLDLPHNGSLDGALINIPIINAAGNFAGFHTVTIDSSFPTGFADAGDVNGVPEPQIPVATGFFLNNNTGNAINWIQSY
jgi:hypothetical protein